MRAYTGSQPLLPVHKNHVIKAINSDLFIIIIAQSHFCYFILSVIERNSLYIIKMLLLKTLLKETFMNNIQACPVCSSEELLIADDQRTIICSECGVIKKNGVYLDKRKEEIEEVV